MPEYAGKPRDECCNRNTDIKRGDRRKRKRKIEGEKKGETSKSGGDYRHLFFTRKGKEKKQRNKRQSIVRHKSVQRSERQ